MSLAQPHTNQSVDAMHLHFFFFRSSQEMQDAVMEFLSTQLTLILHQKLAKNNKFSMQHLNHSSGIELTHKLKDPCNGCNLNALMCLKRKQHHVLVPFVLLQRVVLIQRLRWASMSLFYLSPGEYVPVCIGWRMIILYGIQFQPATLYLYFIMIHELSSCRKFLSRTFKDFSSFIAPLDKAIHLHLLPKLCLHPPIQ